MTKLTAHIGLRMATILVVSIMIGSGVFKKIAIMSALLGSPLLVIGCWALAGFISLAGALSNAEMASMYPDSGGEFIYYQKVYGRLFAFLYGWGNFTVMKSAGIAAIAYIFAQSFNSLLPMPPITPTFTLFGINFLENANIKLLASLLIIILSFINYRGVQFAEKMSSFFTYLTIISILLFIVLGLASSKGSLENLMHPSPIFDPAQLEGFGIYKAITLACLGAFWGYEGWNHIGYLGEEIKNPHRNLPLALIVGTGMVIVLYVLLNVVFAKVLPIDTFINLNQSPNKIAALEVANVLFGKVGGYFLAILIVCTTFTSTNSSILMSARIYYAMARDRLFFKQAATVHPVYKTPSVALGFQAVWSVALIWSGSFDQLTDMLIFATFIFYGSTALAVIILRIKQPQVHRNYRVWGYPFVPVFFVLFCLLLFVVTIINQPTEAFWGLALIATGLPFYWLWKE